MSRGFIIPHTLPGTGLPSMLWGDRLPTIKKQYYFTQESGDTWAGALGSAPTLTSDTTNIYTVRPSGATDRALKVEAASADPRISIDESGGPVNLSNSQVYFRFYLGGSTEDLRQVRLVLLQGAENVTLNAWSSHSVVTQDGGNYPSKAGWHMCQFNLTNLSTNERVTAITGTPNLTAVDTIRLDFDMDADPNDLADVTCDTLAFTALPARGKVGIRIDDNGNDLSTIFALAEARGVRIMWGCIASDTQMTGAGNLMSRMQFDAIKRMSNVDILNHCSALTGSVGVGTGWVWNSAGAGTAPRTTVAAKKADILAAKEWMVANSVGRYKDIVVVPGGIVADDDQDLIDDGTALALWGAGDGQVGGDQADNGRTAWPVASEHLTVTTLASQGADSASRLTAIQARIDEAIAEKSAIVIQGHGAVGGDELDDADWTTLFNDIQGHVAAGDIDSIGADDFFDIPPSGGGRSRARGFRLRGKPARAQSHV